MKSVKIPAAPELKNHLAYAAWFADSRIQAISLDGNDLVVGFMDSAPPNEILAKLDRLIARFANMNAFASETVFETGDATAKDTVKDVYPDLIASKDVIELGQGQVVLRGLPLALFEFFDAAFVREIGGPARAQAEYYPGVMATSRLERTNHFTSFPEHVQFVMHLREDLDVLDKFADELRAAGGWTPELLTKLQNPLGPPLLAVNPAVCYHCYAAREQSKLEGDGVAVTAKSRCHRYEAGNHKTLARLLDFTMREVIFVGAPDFVKQERAAGVARLRALVERWGLYAWLETANDPFFTNDFAVKAAFQRQNDMKQELCMPLAGGKVAVASSNFHSTTFGRAFHITVGSRPACTGCIAFGLERWIYAVLCQLGTNVELWPSGLRNEFTAWQAHRHDGR